jgi:Family of unknown function (DUF6941)
MKRSMRLDYVLVCDDIRQEVGRKPSAMGIFTDDVLVREFPCHFPKLCFLVHGTILSQIEKIKLSATFKYTDKPPLVLVKEQELKTSKTPGGFVLKFVVTPLVLEKPGEGELNLNLNSKRYKKKFSVRKADDPSIFKQ